MAAITLGGGQLDAPLRQSIDQLFLLRILDFLENFVTLYRRSPTRQRYALHLSVLVPLFSDYYTDRLFSPWI